MNLSKIKKLYTNGSSITWGWPLHEERIKKAYSKIGIYYKNREDVIWPTLLANNLKLELVEDSRWGGSADRLIRKTYEYCFKNFDKLNETLFVLELPIGFRTELFSNTLNRIINITRGNIENPIDATESADYVDVYHPAYDRDLKILLVGVGDKTDYVDAIIKLIEMNPDRLNTILKRFEKEDLIEILTEVYDSLKL